MSSILNYLYRGTTPGWEGSGGVREAGITPTSFDPLVATLFAVSCRDFGKSVICVVRKSDFEGLVAPPNFFGDLECAVNLQVLPRDFIRHVRHTIDVDESLNILNQMGFENLPVRLNGPDALHVALCETKVTSNRLSLKQIDEYD